MEYILIVLMSILVVVATSFCVVFFKRSNSKQSVKNFGDATDGKIDEFSNRLRDISEIVKLFEQKNLDKLELITQNISSNSTLSKENKAYLDAQIKEYKHDMVAQINALQELEKQGLSQDQMHFNELVQKFSASEKHFENRIEMQIDRAIKEIDEKNKVDREFRLEIKQNIQNIQNIFVNKSTRGRFGEYQLEKTLESVFGNHKNFYEVQLQADDSRPDAVVFGSESTGKIPIDAKFPHENFQKMIEADSKAELAEADRRLEVENYRKKFANDVKTQIRKVHDYQGKCNAMYSIMYLPSERLFAFIVDDAELLNLSIELKVLIAGPSSLVALLQLVLNSIKAEGLNKNAAKTAELLQSLKKEFSRYDERWISFFKVFEKFGKEVESINTTSKKISKRFRDIETQDSFTAKLNEEFRTAAASVMAEV